MKRFTELMLVLLFLNACTGKLDLKQTEDFDAFPVYTADLFYADITGSDFYVQNMPLTELNDTVPLKIFGQKQVKDGLVKVDFFFDVSNPFPARFAFEVQFLKAGRIPLTAFADTVEAGAASPFRHEYVFTIHKDSLPEIVLTEDMEIRLQRLDTVDLRNDTRSMHIRSKADVYVHIQ
ncbi:MAG: hypothetical protein GXO24_06595 [Chlorobi bacterium]|nr:hypothetical protein [Chlorobiota bacterium]